MKTFIAVCIFTLFGLAGKLQAQTTGPDGNQPVYKSIYDMLRNVPGLEVTTNAKGSGSVIVRGTGSLTRQGGPLFVVDGVIYSGDIGSINPQEVSNITVLKDAASATAYGAQGAAGVIVITMKKGSSLQKVQPVNSFDGSAYKYFIEHKAKLRVFGHDDKVILEGVPAEQRGESLVFKKRKNETLVPIKDIKRVEMMPAE